MIGDNRLGLKLGKRITLVGRVLALDHRAYVINGVFVPPWMEVRVEQSS